MLVLNWAEPCGLKQVTVNEVLRVTLREIYKMHGVCVCVCKVKEKDKLRPLPLRLRSEPTEAAAVMSCMRPQRKDALYHLIATERIAKLRILFPPPSRQPSSPLLHP